MQDGHNPTQNNQNKLTEKLRQALPTSGEGKQMSRRRFFRSALAASVPALFVTTRAKADIGACGAGDCVGGSNICAMNNTCGPNSCTATINVCQGTNICTGDVCSGRNSCIGSNQHLQCGGGGNRC